MEQAIILTFGKHDTLRGISESLGVPRTTLRRQAKLVQEGNLTGPVSMGRKRSMSLDEELYIADWVRRNTIVGWPLLTEDLLDGVKELLDGRGITSKFDNNRPSKGWAGLFVVRHGLTLRKPQALDKGKASVTTDEILKRFEELKAYLR